MSIHDYLTDFNFEPPEFFGERPVHVIAVHIGWLNWGSVGDECIDKLIEYYDAEKIAEFERPGDFYDFITYRDRSFTYIDNAGIRQTEFPNTRVYFVRRENQETDLMLMNLLEPNHFAEVWVDRIIGLLKKLKIERYTVAGAMGSPVPHTRPLRITGRSSDPELGEKLAGLGIKQTLGLHYQGPTSIFNALSPRLTDENITTVNLIAHLPSHISIEEPDFSGVYTILKILAKLENLDIPLERTRIAGRKQYDKINKEVAQSSSLTELSKQLEELYDNEEGSPSQEVTELPPSIQKAIDEAFGRDS